MSKSIRKNVLWMFLGNSVYAFSQWFQISMISKFSSVDTLGQFTLSLAVVAPIFMFSNLQLRGVQITDSSSEFNFSDYFSLRFFSSVLSFLFLLLLSIILKLDVVIILLLSLLKIVEGFSEIFNSRQQLNEQMKMVAISFMLKGINIIISIFVGVYFFNSVPLGISLAVFLNLLVLYFNDFKKCKPLIIEDKILSFFNERSRVKSLFFKALPLGIVMLIVSLNVNVLKYYVEYFISTVVQGVYSSLVYVIVLGNFVLSAIAQTIMPRLGRCYSEGNYKYFKTTSFKFVLLALIIGLSGFLISMFFSHTILVLLFSKEFLKYEYLFKLIMFSSVFIYSASSLGYILTSMREYKTQPWINLCVFLSNLVIGWFFIRKYDIMGVVYSSIISYSIQICITLLIISKKYNEKSSSPCIR